MFSRVLRVPVHGCLRYALAPSCASTAGQLQSFGLRFAVEELQGLELHESCCTGVLSPWTTGLDAHLCWEASVIEGWARACPSTVLLMEGGWSPRMSVCRTPSVVFPAPPKVRGRNA